MAKTLARFFESFWKQLITCQ